MYASLLIFKHHKRQWDKRKKDIVQKKKKLSKTRHLKFTFSIYIMNNKFVHLMSSWQIHRSIPSSSLSTFETKCIYVVIKVLYTDKIINWKK